MPFNRAVFRTGVSLGLLFAFSPSAVMAQTDIQQGLEHSEGRQVYEEYCSSCHDNPEATKSPSADALKQMGVRTILYALTNGKMRVNAQDMSETQIDAVVNYLSAANPVDNSWIADMRCDAPRQEVDSGTPSIGHWGFGLKNQRNLSAEQAGLSRADMDSLELVWAIGFPQTGTMRSQPVVVGNSLFISIPDSGQLFAFDIEETPCVQWAYDHGLPLRSSLGSGTLEDGTEVLVFGDGAAHVQMLDMTTGELRWRTSVRVTSVANTTGMPVLHEGVVYAPVSSGELNMGAAPDYECCTSHGAVVALDAQSGEDIWTYHTMEDATPREKSRIGTQLWGPSGAPIWTTPAIDEKRGVLYVGTGQNTSEPATDTSDAVLAINLDDGSLKWKFQATENDIFLTGCMFEPDGPNCPPDYSVNADWDFGASMMLAHDSEGNDVVLAGQKSGMLWALDPDTGELLWDTDVGPGGPVGGIHWGMAFDGESVYVPINQVGIVGEPEDREPGLHAIDVDTGKVLWSFINEPDCSNGREERIPTCADNYGMSSATLLVDGVVVQGSNDGFLRIFDSEDGELLFQYDAAHEFETVNGIEARGGAIDNATIIAANGMLLVQSGYGLMGAPGNILIALKPAD